MPEQSNIRYLRNKEIDRQEWDDCVSNSSNRLIYPRTFYLDNMAGIWDAFIGDHYEWVFPITPRKKYGFSYLTQPALTQQLGVFAKPGIVVPFNEILTLLRKHYQFWEINFNYATNTQYITAPVSYKPATNFILDLSVGYEKISCNYHHDLVKNLKRSKRVQLTYRVSYDYNKAIELFKKYYGSRLENIHSSDYKNFSITCACAAQKHMLLCREIIKDKNELLSIILIMAEGNRLYNLMNVTTPAGRNFQANHLLIDQVIREYSGQNFIFDFEGSDVSGIKHFYQNFGATDQPFFQLKYNNLPWPIKLLKK